MVIESVYYKSYHQFVKDNITTKLGGVSMDEKLAINGGTPVREYPLLPPYPGASLYGDEDKTAIE